MRRGETKRPNRKPTPGQSSEQSVERRGLTDLPTPPVTCSLSFWLLFNTQENISAPGLQVDEDKLINVMI